MSNEISLSQIAELLDQKLDQKLTPIQKELRKHREILADQTSILQEHSFLLDQYVMLKVLHREQINQQQTLTIIGKKLNLLILRN